MKIRTGNKGVGKEPQNASWAVSGRLRRLNKWKLLNLK